MRSQTPDDPQRPEVPEVFDGSFVVGRFSEGVTAIRNRLADYWLNHAFLLGYQWTFVEADTGTVREAPEEPGREQAVVNRMWANHRTLMGKLTQRQLEFEVPPNGADDGTVRGARIAEAVLRGTKRDHNWERKRELLASMILKGGTAAMAVEWDPHAGHVVVGPSEDSKEIRGGDTIETVLGLHQFVVEPGVKEAEFARWWIKAESLPPKTVQSVYNLEAEPRADVTAGQSDLQRKLIASSNMSTAAGEGVQEDLTLVLTYYERPNIHAPEGRVAVVVNGSIVWGENEDTGEKHPWPFPFKDRLNLTVGVETVLEDEWTGQTVYTAVRGPQALLNVSWSSIIEHMKLAGNARLVVPQSSLDLIEQLSDTPGEILPVNDGEAPPFYVQPAQLPGWLVDVPNELKLQIDDLMGVHDVSRGIAPANIESGFGVSILSENDSTPVGRVTKEIARMFSETAKMALQLFEAEVTETRQVTVAEPGDVPMTTSWTGKDLLGQVDAVVPPDAIVPRNRAAQLKMAQDMMAMGLIETIDEFMAVAELADHVGILENVDPDTARARRENHAFRTGRGVHVQTWDNHDAHIREHNRLRKSRAYEMMSPVERRAVDLHIQGHATNAAEQAGAADAALTVGGPSLAAAPTADEIPLAAALGGALPVPPPTGELPPSGDTIPDIPAL